jgi:hypothetical protein
MLESINMLSGSLSQTKHGLKVLTKLQKSYPHVFTGAANAAIKSKVSANNGIAIQIGSQQKKRSGNRKG